MAQDDGVPHHPDLQRGRQRALLADQPPAPERPDQRDGHPRERAESQHQSRLHEARDAGRPGVRQALERVRPAGRVRSAHVGRVVSRLLPHVLAAAQSRHERAHHVADEGPVVPVRDEEHQGQTRVGHVLLRQRGRRRTPRCGARRARRHRHGGRASPAATSQRPTGSTRPARVGDLRTRAPLPQQLRRDAQPLRALERGLLLRDVRGSHQGHELLHGRGAGICAPARRPDQEARGRRRQGINHRQVARYAGANQDRRSHRHPDGRGRRRDQPRQRRRDEPAQERRHPGEDDRPALVRADRHRGRRHRVLRPRECHEGVGAPALAWHPAAPGDGAGAAASSSLRSRATRSVRPTPAASTPAATACGHCRATGRPRPMRPSQPARSPCQ